MRDGWGAAFRLAAAFAVVAGAAWLLHTLQQLLLILFAGAVVAAGLAGITDRLRRAGLPHPAAVLAPFATLLLVLLGLAAATAAPLAAEAEAFTRSVQSRGDVPGIHDLLLEGVALLRTYVPALAAFEGELTRAARQVADQVSGQGAATGGPGPVLTGAARATAGIATAAFSLLFTFVVALYLLWDRDGIRRYLISLVPDSRRGAWTSILDRMAGRIGGWVLGQATICAIVGLATYAALLVIGVPFALGLAIFAALAELVPLLGPMTAAALGVTAAASVSVPHALGTLAFYLLFQQVDSYLLAPRILGAAVRIHPLAVLVAVGIGAELFGIAGALLSPAAATAIGVLLEEWRLRTRPAGPDTSPPSREEAPFTGTSIAATRET